MSEMAAPAALLLAGVFAWAALAKVGAPGATALGLRRLGLPVPRVLAAILPAAEAGLAVLLVLSPRAGGLTALLLLAVFAVVLAAGARRGSGGCACFGGAGADTPASTALLRNGLLAVAAVVAAAPPTGRLGLPGMLATGAAAVLGVVGLALWDLRARTGRLWDNRPAGTPPRTEGAR